jgi:hypothetical protein
MLVSENAGYKVMCETRKLDVPAGSNYVRIYTVYDWAKDPTVAQNRLELILTDEELIEFRKALTI